MKRTFFGIFLFALLWAIHNPAAAQELEPRNLTNLPKGINFFSAGYAYASGNTLLDPSLPLEDFNGRFNSIIVAYVRSVNFWGKSGKKHSVKLALASGIRFKQGSDFDGFAISYQYRCLDKRVRPKN